MQDKVVYSTRKDLAVNAIAVLRICHDDVIKWKHFPRYWPFVRGIHRSAVNSPHKGQWRGASMFVFYLRLNKRLSKQSWGWWFETPSRPLWRQCNGKCKCISIFHKMNSARRRSSCPCAENQIVFTFHVRHFHQSKLFSLVTTRVTFFACDEKLWIYSCFVSNPIQIQFVPLTISQHCLTHWGRVTHICVSKLTIIGSDNGLSPGRRQAIIWTNAGILLIRALGTNFSEMLIEILTFSFMKMRLKVSSAKWRPFCLDLNVNQRHHLTWTEDESVH